MNKVPGYLIDNCFNVSNESEHDSLSAFSSRIKFVPDHSSEEFVVGTMDGWIFHDMYDEYAFDIDGGAWAAYQEIRQDEEIMTSTDCMIYIDEVIIRPEFRGHGLGLRSIQQAIITFKRLFKNSELCLRVCLTSCPLVKRDGDKSENFNKLLSYWRKTGMDLLGDNILCGDVDMMKVFVDLDKRPNFEFTADEMTQMKLDDQWRHDIDL